LSTVKFSGLICVPVACRLKNVYPLRVLSPGNKV
jgi:hypothetical protein